VFRIRDVFFISDPNPHPNIFSFRILHKKRDEKDPYKIHPGSRFQRGKKHRIPDTDPQHCSEDTSTGNVRKYHQKMCRIGQQFIPDADPVTRSTMPNKRVPGTIPGTGTGYEEFKRFPSLILLWCFEA
jgi:hypothetical protein